MLTMNLAIGFCSPPYGINLFVASSISKVSIEDLTKKIIKPLLALIAVTAFDYLRTDLYHNLPQIVKAVKY